MSFSNNSIAITLLLFISLSTSAVTYTVDNLATDTDDGNYTAGNLTLREAINLANASVGVADIINFNYGAAGPYTVNIATALPALTDNAGVTIDGFSNPGASANTIPVFSATAGTPMNAVYMVILNNNTVTVNTGFIVNSNFNVIKGFVIQNFGVAGYDANDIGIKITGTNNQILGCYIGMDIGGTTRAANTQIGIYIDGSTNSIGDGTAAGANLISGTNDYCGILLTGKGAAGGAPYPTGINVKGNMIGLQKDGATIVAGTNTNGILISQNLTGSTIGGILAGEGNVISGNTIGITLNSFSTINVYGNYIGPRADGLTAVTSNTQSIGIDLLGKACIIGGNTAGHRNIISGNSTYGINLATVTYQSQIKGNYIGLGANGTTVIANGSSGIYSAFIFAPGIPGTTIGGTGAGDGNIISGNGTYGISLTTVTNTGVTVQGNYIGTDFTGLVAKPNGLSGIYINNGVQNTIGGSVAGAGNVISGNTLDGITVSGTSASNTIKGNYIGINANGTAALPNSNNGINITATGNSNVIGGTTTLERNIISGNTLVGISLNATGAGTGVTIQGNYIGTDNTGLVALPNSSGISISSSDGNIIGGSVAGTMNVISGNTTAGVGLSGTSASNQIKGNYIGVAANGTTALANNTYGISLSATGNSNVIGGTAVLERNIISGNGNVGVRIFSTGSSTGVTVQGNYIGTDYTGLTGLPNNSSGVSIQNSNGNIVGGSVAGARNIISGNWGYGIQISGTSASTAIKGNYIGLDANGTAAVENFGDGIQATGSGLSNVIGGSTALERNVISGQSGAAGIGIGNTGAAPAWTIQGNYIGTDYTGLVAIGNAVGLSIFKNGNTIGGTVAAGTWNLISGNTNIGILINSSSNTIKGNYIGVNATGTAALANGTDGIQVIGSASSNTIGGTAAGEGNIIGYNGNDGIDINSASADFNLISRNSIFCNSGKGINLNYSGTAGNDGQAIPVIVLANTAGASGTSSANAAVELFYNHSCAGCQGKTYITTVTADGSGNWSHVGALTAGASLLATATSTTNNTSEFSSCWVGLPIELLLFTAQPINSNYVLLNWITATETNNDYFTIERSIDGVNTEIVATVKGAGNSTSTLKYSLVDSHPINSDLADIIYYRLKQTDFDGKHEYFNWESAKLTPPTNNTALALNVYPNPALSNDEITLHLNGTKADSEVLILVMDVLGKLYYSKVIMGSSHESIFIIDNKLNLAPGIYLISASSNDSFVGKKIIVK